MQDKEERAPQDKEHMLKTRTSSRDTSGKGDVHGPPRLLRLFKTICSQEAYPGLCKR